MNCQADIQRLAWEKYNAAMCLLSNGLSDQAYYLAGYTVELLLKAMVCKTLKVDDFFAFNRARPELYKAYKVHNYEELLLLSGLLPEFESINSTDLIFKGHWSIVKTWKEDSRYLTGKTIPDVQSFVTSIKEFGLWIERHL